MSDSFDSAEDAELVQAVQESLQQMSSTSRVPEASSLNTRRM
ncbi:MULTISPECIES: hypothetical protein [Leptolyngbya]|nr:MULTISPECIES: hypothetical protein [Leptolyngbya]